MFKNLSLGAKLLIFFLLVGILPFATLGIISLNKFETSLTDQVSASLAGFAEYKTQSLEGWLEDRKNDIHSKPLMPFYVDAVRILQDNDRQAAAKMKEKVLHEFGVNYKLHGDFNDMKIIDLDGNILVSRLGNYNNVKNSSWFQAALVNARKTVKGSKCQDLYISPIEFCKEQGLPSVHFSHMIRDRKTFKPLAVLVAGANVEHVMTIVKNNVGMGKTGESFLVGPDMIMRSNMAHEATPTIFEKRIDTEGVREIFAQRETQRGKGYCKNWIYENHEGEKVLAHNHYFAGLGVAVISEIELDEALAAVSASQWLMVIIGGFGLAAIIAVALLITRSVTVPISKTVGMIEALQSGNLDNRLHLERNDELGHLGKAMDNFADSLQHEIVAAFDKLAAGDFTFEAEGLIKDPLARANSKLNELMTQIRLTGEQVSSGTTEVSSASQALSEGAASQASSLEEIAASMQQLAAQTGQNAEHANQANGLSNEAKEIAEKGSGHMSEMMAAMSEINESGQSISKIIKVIDEIAFQTNLLALNAAVEAARAGQHGKGFAVVAEEVRNLAARSAKAARETSELIESSVTKADNGVRIAALTSEALGEIVTGVTKVTELVADIASSSNEQAQGISEVNQGLGQIDQVTQQNTAQAEETAAAALELSTQANQQKQLLSRLSLKDGRQSPSASDIRFVDPEARPNEAQYNQLSL